jgi:hypothetical protein
MAAVVIRGWRPGLQKVSLTKLLQQRAGLRLSAAHDCTTRLLAGETVRLELPSLDEADQFVEALERLGAMAEVERAPQRR